MLALAFHNQPTMLQWAAGRVSDAAGTWPRGAAAIGIVDDETGRIRAVVVECETYEGIIDVHIASDGSSTWATEAIMTGIFGYLFIVRRAFRLQGIIPVDAPRSHVSMLLRAGFEVEGTLRNGVARDRDAIMFGMTIQACPWIEPQDKEPQHG